MVGTPLEEFGDRQGLIDDIEAETRRWSRSVDVLLRAFCKGDRTIPKLAPRMEALRNKRDTVVTKVEALKRHRESGWSRAHREFLDARRELRESWRSVISTLDKETPVA
jgi:hypothetical protein